VTVAAVEVRLATAEDTVAVADLEQSALGADAWSPALLAEGLEGRLPTMLYLVATADHEVVGYAAASMVADLAELQRIAVTAPRRRTGVASGLLARVEREALTRHADRLLLEVRENNHDACAFYAVHGFAEIDRRPRYYADGTTAVVLVKELRS
jgi:[ribosomal protein S18]-alanine N-acetyltransferase